LKLKVKFNLKLNLKFNLKMGIRRASKETQPACRQAERGREGWRVLVVWRQS
jgi:hypothetical protein